MGAQGYHPTPITFSREFFCFTLDLHAKNLTEISYIIARHL